MANNQQLLLGEGAGGGIPNYIEEVFSTYLYTGNSSTQTITNNIDLSTKGGMVWIKNRTDAVSHYLWDTVRGITPSSHKSLQSDTTAAQVDYSSGFGVQSVSSTGFELGGLGSAVNGSTKNYVSWTFREQPKFFDIVTYTGTGSNTTIAHTLGAVPGCIIVKRTDTTADWAVYHRSLANTEYLVLNDTAAKATGATWWNSTTPTSSVFSIGTDASVNASGGTYVAYIFAHDAGGFGLAGTDNVISCGSFTTDGSSNATITLGYEPQWVFTKDSQSVVDWYIADIIRGMALTGASTNFYLTPNTSGADTGSSPIWKPNATGFTVAGLGTASKTHIYIAIRRGPMEVPTVGTSVFSPIARTGTGAAATVSGAGFAPDLLIVGDRNGATGVNGFVGDRLRGPNAFLHTYRANAEALDTVALTGFTNDGVTFGADGTAGSVNYSGTTYVNWLFQRAPGFFDEVCYTGNGAGSNAKTHNLTVAPELLIIKNRSSSGSGDWYTFHTFTVSNFKKQLLSATDAQTNYSYGSFLDAQPSSTTFTVNSGAACNESGVTYVAYLFATCAGVSKVGTYTGTAAAQVINCGFTSGARFVLIKRTDSTGDWYVWDSARGIIAGNDPYLLLNSTAAEVTSTDYIDTASTGFEISSTAPAAINASAGTFIFLAIA